MDGWLTFQVVLAKEHLLVQGIANFPEVAFRRIRRADVRVLAGNGMHAAAVGSVLLFAFGATDFK